MLLMVYLSFRRCSLYHNLVASHTTIHTTSNSIPLVYYPAHSSPPRTILRIFGWGLGCTPPPLHATTIPFLLHLCCVSLFPTLRGTSTNPSHGHSSRRGSILTSSNAGIGVCKGSSGGVVLFDCSF